MKMYQAIDAQICIKQFAPDLEPGWFATTQEALAAYQQDTQPSPVNPVNPAEQKRRGRPPKGK